MFVLVTFGSFRLYANLARFQRDQIPKSSFPKSSFPDKVMNSGKPKDNFHNAMYSGKSSGTFALIFKRGAQNFSVPKQTIPKPFTSNQSPPALVLDDSYFIDRDLSRSLIGKVKEVFALQNLFLLLEKEGFQNLNLTHLGGLWVLIDMDSSDSKEKFHNHTGVGSWFSNLKPACDSFLCDERIVWISIEGLPLKGWSRNIFANIASKWGELIDWENIANNSFAGKRICVKMKFNEIISEKFIVIVQASNNSSSDGDSDGDVDGSIHKTTNDVDRVWVSSCMHATDILYEKSTYKNESGDEDDLSHPPSFTPKTFIGEEDQVSIKGVNVEEPNEEVKTMPSKINDEEHVADVGVNAKEINESAKSTSSNHTVMDTWIPSSTKLLIISVYAPQELTDKKELWDYLRLLIDRWEGEYVILGDDNEVRSEHERFDSVFNVQGFDKLVEDTWLNTITKDLNDLDKILDLGGSNEDILNTRSTLLKELHDINSVESLEKALTFPDQKEDLEHNVTLNEIKSAIWDCGEFSSGCNSSFIALILKIHDVKVSARGSVLVNGSLTSEFQFHKGLKQGDPLYPFLFILVMESLHISFKRVMDAGLFSGIAINNSLTISNFFYADDAFFVGKWVMSNIRTVVNVLKCFHMASGLKLNIHKSKIMGVKFELKRSDMSRISSWDEVISKVSSRLSKWKLNNLSIGGRLTLIKYVLSSIPLYHMSIFRVPMGVLHSMESIRRNFFKGTDGSKRKSKMISWNKVLASKKYGGLVGNGEDTIFWNDIWLDDMALKHRYPRLYALESSKHISISDKLSNDSLISLYRHAPRGGIKEDQQRSLQARIDCDLVLFGDIHPRRELLFKDLVHFSYIWCSSRSQMHNNIKGIWFKDRPPMLATRRFHNAITRFLTDNIDTRPNGDALRKCILECKEIAKPITPPSESASEEDSDPEQAQRDKDMQKNLALIAKYFKKIYKPTNNNLRTSSNTRNKNVDTTLRYKNDNQTGQFGNQRAVNVAGARETVGGQDEEIDEQELEVHYSYIAKIQEVPNADSGTDSEPLEQVQYDTDNNVFANDIQHFEQSESISNTCAVETGDSNVIPDSPDMCDNDIQDDQNDVECDDKRVALANLIANLKLDVDESKKIQKQLKKANATLTQELTKYKSILAETSRTLRESNSMRDSCLVALQNKQTEFERYKAFNDRTVDYDKLEHKLNETLRLLAQKEIDIKEGLKVKAYEILVVKEKHDELVKQSLLTKSHYEGLVKEKTKVITDLKLKYNILYF
ncbi:retrovirus-related pol polyprotein from transposon TNT 1-94 [Tanacetum coccineum]|uniref:Retrovirus-related pol polyprotein from transposon TNT 1-94 n=1 Tax=Tanacetum coccineum TaxID=301880 RepID=A0ABQ5E3R0_9ASTR